MPKKKDKKGKKNIVSNIKNIIKIQLGRLRREKKAYSDSKPQNSNNNRVITQPLPIYINRDIPNSINTTSRDKVDLSPLTEDVKKLKKDIRDQNMIASLLARDMINIKKEKQEQEAEEQRVGGGLFGFGSTPAKQPKREIKPTPGLAVRENIDLQKVFLKENLDLLNSLGLRRSAYSDRDIDNFKSLDKVQQLYDAVRLKQDFAEEDSQNYLEELASGGTRLTFE